MTLTHNSPTPRKMDCAAFQLADVEWDSRKGRFRFIRKNPVEQFADWVVEAVDSFRRRA